jgi:hypothetical protein
MGIQQEAPSAPDTYGLVEYFATEVFTEISGTNVRMVVGVKRGNQTNWLFSVVMPADCLIPNARQCESAALEAFNLVQMTDRRATAH